MDLEEVGVEEEPVVTAEGGEAPLMVGKVEALAGAAAWVAPEVTSSVVHTFSRRESQYAPCRICRRPSGRNNRRFLR